MLVISFFALAVLWPKPRLEEDAWRPMPGGRVIASAPVQALCGAIGVGLLVVTILGGYLGPENALDNWAPTFVMIIVWVGLVFASILFGDVFKAFSPWRALGRLLPQRRRAYPEKLGRWPAAVGLFVFVWIELVSGWGEDPPMLATAIVGYTILTLALQARLRRRDLDRARRGLRRLLQPLRAPVDLRDPRRRGRRAAAARRAAEPGAACPARSPSRP